MLKIKAQYFSLTFAVGLVLLLPLTLWLIAIVLKIFGAEFLFRAVSLPIGIKNLTNILLYILVLSLIINFVKIVIINMKKAYDNNEVIRIYRVSMVHIGLMSFTFCHVFITYVLYAFDWLGSIPIGQG